MTRRRLLRPEHVQALTLNSEPWLSCDECFARVDGYVERFLSGAEGRDHELGVHLVACPACFDEARSLVTLRALDLGIPPLVALEAFGDELDTYSRPVQ